MKKILISLSVAVLLFTGCDPIEDRDGIGTGITDDELMGTVTVVQENGKNINRVICDSHSPVNTTWTNGVLSKPSAHAELTMFATGDQVVTLIGLNADGTQVSKEFTVNIEEMSPNYPVAPEYALFCENGEKVWVWDQYTGISSNSTAGVVENAPWGNGGYLGSVGPAWWNVGMSDLDNEATKNECAGDGKDAFMTFKLNGLQLVKSSGASGTFNFDMSDITLEGWDIGKFKTSSVNVLLGVNPNNNKAPVYEYNILKLNEDVLWLASPSPGAGSWGEAFFWCFRAQGSTPE